MKSKHDKSNGSNSDRESNGKGDKYDSSKNAASNDIDDSMSDGGDRSRSGSENRNDRSSKDHDALSIYIGNVDYSATEEELRNTFIGCGEIVRVTIIKNMKTGHPKGAAFIEFTDKDGVQAAMLLNGKEVKGRPLIVTSKKPRPENRSRDSRYQTYDRRQPRPPPHYSAPYGGGRGPYGPGQPSRGGYYHGMSGQFDSRRGHPPAPMQMSMDQARMQPRYDPYRRPEFYDPYMMQRSSAGAPPAPYYQDKMGGGGGGSHSRTSQPPQRYSNPFGSRK